MCIRDRRNTDLFNTHLVNFQGLVDEPWDLANTSLVEVFGPTIDHEAYLGTTVELVQGHPGALPAFITAIADRDGAALLQIVEGGEDVDDDDGPGEQEPGADGQDFAAGLNYSVYCAEEAPFFDLDTNPIATVDEWPQGTADLFLPPVDQLCEIWDVDPADPSDGDQITSCLLYTSPSPRDKRQSRMPSSA